METENGAKLATLQQEIRSGRAAYAARLGKPDGLLGIRWDADVKMSGREERSCWRRGGFSWPARVGWGGTGGGLSGPSWQRRVSSHRWGARSKTRHPEKWDKGETRASLCEVTGLEDTAMQMAQGREGRRAGSEAACGGQWSVPGLMGLLMGLLFLYWWLLPRAVPQGRSLGT